MIQAIIYLPSVSKTVFRTRDFQRCVEHDNLLAYGGRPLSMAEFNVVAPKLLSQNTITTYGSLPCVKLVEVPEVVVVDPVTDVTAPAATAPTEIPPVAEVPVVPPVAVPLPEGVFVDEIEGGYILSDMRSGAAFLGCGESGWQADISLVEPFPTAEAATAAFTQPPASEAPPEAHPVTGESAPAAEAAPEPAPAPAKKSHHKKK